MSTRRFFHLAVAALVWALPQSSWAQAGSAPDLDTACYFYPQGPGCEEVYQRALKDAGPVAISVRDAFEKYARYLQDQAGGLTEEIGTISRRMPLRCPSSSTPAIRPGFITSSTTLHCAIRS